MLLLFKKKNYFSKSADKFKAADFLFNKNLSKREVIANYALYFILY